MPTAQEDIVDSLLAHHQQIKVLFTQVEAAVGEHKQQLFQELVALLAVHESVEETLIHPLAERILSDADAVVPPRLAEEQAAKQALSHLYDLGVEHPQFNGELIALRDAVAAHAEAEELLEFERLRELVDPAELSRLRSAMTVAATLAPTRPHPDVPANPAASVLLGTPLAVFDRVRDALRDAGVAS
jgi:hemerythrin superfamily protein